jgi:sec-independent protein translocase protein TatC
MKQPDGHSRSAMTLYDHIRELQMRLFVSVIALAVAGLAVYVFYEPLLELLRSPLGTPLYYSTPAGSFAFVMKICFMGALIITTPIIVYNLIMFVRPAFEKSLPIKRVLSTTLSSAFLAIAGAIFAFTCILPGTLSFFAGFQVEGLSALISADDYLNFVTNIIITFVIVFQLPLLIIFIDSIKPLSPKKLFGMEKWVILGSLVISLLTPFTYDPVTSLLIALPIVVLYNLSIIIVLLKHAIVARRERATAREIVFQPTKQTMPLPEPSLAFNNLFANDLIDKTPKNFEQLTPAPVIVPRRAGMDIRPTRSRPAPVVSITSANNKPKPVKLSTQVRLISDINSAPRTNRFLAQ